MLAGENVLSFEISFEGSVRVISQMRNEGIPKRGASMLKIMRDRAKLT